MPVLSEQSTSIPAISSIDSSRVTIAFILDSATAPTAIVTDSTAGIATGIAATVRISANWMRVSTSTPRESSTITSTATKTRLSQIR